MPNENNKMQVDIDTLKKQNVNDLLSIKELYSKLEELGEKITQIKYIDNALVKKLKKQYEELEKIITDENIQVKLTNDIESINSQMETIITTKFSSVYIFNYDRTGEKDESINLQNTINSLKNEFLNNNLTNNIKFIIKGGILRLNNKVTIPPYIHIYVDGLLIINSYVSEGSTIHITNDESDRSFYEFSEKQCYLKGSLISATEGIVFKSKLPYGVNSIALELGSTTDIGQHLPISRYNIQDILVEGFDIGLKMNVFNHYIGTFNRCSFERNTISVYFGDDSGTSASNSGENFSFLNCIFSGSEIGLYYNVDGFDSHFFGCSFDFNDILIKTKKGYKTLSLFGCHIEGNDIILDATENTQGYFSLHLYNCTMFIFYGIMFKGNAYVSLSNLKALMSSVDYTKGLYICDDDITIVENDTYIQGEYNYITSRKLNVINKDRFDDLTVDGTTLIKDLTEYAFNYGAITGFIATDSFPTGSTFTKVLKVESTSTGNWITIKTIDYKCSPSESFTAGLTIYAENMTKLPNFDIKIAFKDNLGNVISQSAGYVPKNSSDINKWVSLYCMRNIIAPKGAATVSVTFTIAAIEVGQNVYLGEISLCKR